jgi:lipoprotein signal peptidase
VEKEKSKIRWTHFLFFIGGVVIFWIFERILAGSGVGAINSKMLWGVIGNNVEATVVLFVVGTLSAVLYIKRAEYRTPLFFLILGITKNLVDRLLLGGVFDYMKISSFPIFNLADLCIVGGLFWLVFSVLEPRKNPS